MQEHLFSGDRPDNSRWDVLAIGEAMVEYNQQPGDAPHMYLQGFGGDTSNVVIAAARQGVRSGYISAVGDDPHGRMLQTLWQDEGVYTGDVVVNPDAFTGVYFVNHDHRGHHFSFVRKGSAASQYHEGLLRAETLQATRLLYLSGIALAISSSAAAACMRAVAIARDAQRLIAFDTNYRPSLWSVEQARPAMLQMLQHTDICLPGLDDVAAVFGMTEPLQIVDFCRAQGAQVVALKLGAAGAIVADRHNIHHIAPVACQPVDATGAGDTFGGAFLARLLDGDSLLDAGRYAATAAAMSTEGMGAVGPIPQALAVRQRLTS